MKGFLLVVTLIAVTEVGYASIRADMRAHATLDTLADAAVMRHGEVELKRGVRVHYVEQGDRSGPPIILLHGYSDSWVSWTRVLPLIDKKYRVYVPDLRGHGDSDRPARGYTFP